MEHLSISLRSFGLNPLEWNIRRLRGTRYSITHKFETDFEFQGEVEYRLMKPRWKLIRLLSI